MHISIIAKKLADSNISPIRPYNMVNFGPLTAEMGSGVWGTPANFNGFRVLASFFTSAMSLTGGQPNFGRCLTIFCAATEVK